MSWIEDVENKTLSVFMGDGKVFTPLWKNAQKRLEWNVSIFEFPEIEGSLVKRRQPKGSVYDIEFYFTGEDHLETYKDFEKSSKDRRHWHISHPLYGSVRVQPISIRVNNSDMNVTVITGAVMETILGDYPKSLPAPKDVINTKVESSNVASASGYSQAVKNIEASQLIEIEEVMDSSKSFIDRGISETKDYNNYINLYRKALTELNRASSTVNQKLIAVQNSVIYPSLIQENIKFRINLLRDQFNRTRDLLFGSRGVDNTSMDSRSFYESYAGTIVTAVLLASSLKLKDEDYESSRDVEEIITSVISIWNTYIQDLDDLQFIEQGNEDRFVPNECSLSEKTNLFNFTISNLFDIALEAKKEITINIKEDSNILLLTHRFYGLDQEDENISFFKRTNNIGLKEILLIKKGREIVYYV